MIASERVGVTSIVPARPVDSSVPRTASFGQASATTPPVRSAMRCAAKNTPRPMESTKLTSERSKTTEWRSPSSCIRRSSTRRGGAVELSSSPRRRNSSSPASRGRRSQKKDSVTTTADILLPVARGRSRVMFLPGDRGNPPSGGEAQRGRIGVAPARGQQRRQRGEEGVDGGRVELGPAAVADDPDRSLDAGGVLVDALGGHGVEDVR